MGNGRNLLAFIWNQTIKSFFFRSITCSWIQIIRWQIAKYVRCRTRTIKELLIHQVTNASGTISLAIALIILKRTRWHTNTKNISIPGTLFSCWVNEERTEVYILSTSNTKKPRNLSRKTKRTDFHEICKQKIVPFPRPGSLKATINSSSTTQKINY